MKFVKCILTNFLKRTIMKTQLSLLICFLLGIFNSFSQNIPGKDIVQEFLSADELQKITESEKLLQKGDQVMSKVSEEDKKTSKIKRAKRMERKSAPAKLLRVEAFTEYEKSYQTVYDLYLEKLNTLTFDYQEDKTFVDQKRNEAAEANSKAKSMLKSYKGLDKSKMKKTEYSRLKSDFSTIKQKHELSLTLLANCFLVHNQAKVKKQKEIEDKKTFDAACATNTVASYDEYITKFPSGKYVAEATERKNKLTEEAAEAERKRLEAAAAAQNKQIDSSGVFYMVQILAVHTQKTLEQLAKVYPETDKIVEYQDVDGLYKYALGLYKTYQGVIEFRRNIAAIVGEENCFVIAFQGTNRIPVYQAQKQENK